MKKDFKQELTELINKHSLEKEMRDTPDFIWHKFVLMQWRYFRKQSPAVTNGTNSERQTKRVRRMQNTITRMIAIFAKTVLNVLTL